MNLHDRQLLILFNIVNSTSITMLCERLDLDCDIVIVNTIIFFLKHAYSLWK